MLIRSVVSLPLFRSTTNSHQRPLVAAALALLLVGTAATAGPIFPPDAKFDVVSRDVDFAEGPAAGLDGAVYFTDIPKGEKPGRILKYDPAAGKISVFAADSRKANGLFVDAVGGIVACEGADFGGRAIARYTPDGVRTVLTADFQGKKYNAPNDLCIDGKGRIFFTDPKYLGDEPRELDQRGVYRIDPDGKVFLVVGQPEIDKPNGVHASLDGTVLYVADTCDTPIEVAGGGTRPGRMQLVAFPLKADGAVDVAGKKVVTDYGMETGVDGMTLDAAGNLYCAVRSKARPGVVVYSAEGKEIDYLVTPVPATNCVFGRGAEAGRLYVTMDTGLGRVQTTAQGFHPAAPK
ncbi:MAG: SMP-30/gluconolactonase/LRE family protein [Planctomycetia bacterium]